MREYEKKGGVIKVLDQGETTFPDGILPRPDRRPPHQPDDNTKIDAINAAIQSSKASAPPKKASKKNKKIRYRLINLCPDGWGIYSLSRLAEQIKQKPPKLPPKSKKLIIHYLFSEPPAGLGVLAKSRLVTQDRRQKANLKRKSQERQRQKKVFEDFLQALLENKTEFVTTCRYHAETVFEINRSESCSICKICKQNQRYEYCHISIEQFDRYKRSAQNHQQMMQAIHLGHSYFLGDCINCGTAKFHYKTIKGRTNKTLYRMSCVKCMNKSGRKDKHSRGEERLRRKTLELLRQAAIQANQSTFLAPCAVHQMSEFILTKDNDARCLLCKADQNEKTKLKECAAIGTLEEHLSRKERKEFNHRQMEVALREGRTTFTGNCINCQESEFKLKKVGYACIVCARESSRKNIKNQIKKKLQEAGIPEQEYQANHLRKTQNRQKCDEAIKQNQFSFIGTCKSCNDTLFKIVRICTADKIRYEYHCAECMRKANKERYLKKTAAPIIASKHGRTKGEI